jgi:hypothetical protein
MERKDWLVPVLAAMLGMMAAWGGGLVAGYQHERAIARQMLQQQASQQVAHRAAELKAFKDAGLSYMSAVDALVHQSVFATARDKPMADPLSSAQATSHQLVLMADEELTHQTLALNQALLRLSVPTAQPMTQRLAELNAMVLEWIKLFKRNLNALKTQHEEAMGLNASVQVAATLKRQTER